MESNITKKIIFSGIQPTGVPTIGNYIGAIKNWKDLQEEYNCIYSIVDMHAITVRQEPALLRRQTLESYALIIACGISPEKSIAFIQSHVKQHAQLSWILSCYTPFGDLSRMTQFKDKSLKHSDNVNAGLFTYPILMAADILLYQTDLVPVGSDQKQHLELARDIATRFNNIYPNVLKVPEPYIKKLGSKVMSLSDPSKKMSKSDDNINGFISILDRPEVIVKKFRRAVTDSDSNIHFGDNKDGINNMMSIYSAITSKSYKDIEREFSGKGYGYFKEQVGNCVAEHLIPIQNEFDRLLEDKTYIETCYKEGAVKAENFALRTIKKLEKKIGFLS